MRGSRVREVCWPQTVAAFRVQQHTTHNKDSVCARRYVYKIHCQCRLGRYRNEAAQWRRQWPLQGNTVLCALRVCVPRHDGGCRVKCTVLIVPRFRATLPMHRDIFRLSMWRLIDWNLMLWKSFCCYLKIEDVFVECDSNCSDSSWIFYWYMIFVKNSFYALVRFNQFDSYVFMILIIYRLLNTENLYEYIKIFILYITSIYYIRSKNWIHYIDIKKIYWFLLRNLPRNTPPSKQKS